MIETLYLPDLAAMSFVGELKDIEPSGDSIWGVKIRVLVQGFKSKLATRIVKGFAMSFYTTFPYQGLMLLLLIFGLLKS